MTFIIAFVTSLVPESAYTPSFPHKRSKEERKGPRLTQFVRSGSLPISKVKKSNPESSIYSSLNTIYYGLRE